MFVLAQGAVDQLPSDVVSQLPPDVARDLSTGVIDKIPREVLDELPASVAGKIPRGLIQAASANPALTAILIGVGAIAAVMLVWGIVKSAWKAAFFAAVAGGGAWYWYFNIR